MIPISTNDDIGGDGGEKLFNLNPGTGSIDIYRSLPGGGFSSTPFKTINPTTPESDRAFILPTPSNMMWRFILNGDAIAEYSRLQTFKI
tara:strand:- start:62 stop:328 length:267 start_codon:yes stop_codon:yes gene_type:complete